VLGNPLLRKRSGAKEEQEKKGKNMWSIILHAGATNEPPSKKIQNLLEDLVIQGAHALEAGMSSEEVVSMIIAQMESIPLFNAGKGAIFSPLGKKELDASIMRGSDLGYGEVIGSNVAHPILLVRRFMNGMKKSFFSFYEVDNRGNPIPCSLFTHQNNLSNQVKKHLGTVGCVAMDQKGHLCAGTSTGGVPGKPEHRYGDVGMIGQGTYADDQVVAVSISGNGEKMIPFVPSFHVWALMKYAHFNIQQALDYLIQKVTVPSTIGIIAIDHKGNIAQAYNTKTFQTASMTSNRRKGFLPRFPKLQLVSRR
jgi:beta-aspartyl-peptidase (threonine type)